MTDRTSPRGRRRLRGGVLLLVLGLSAAGCVRARGEPSAVVSRGPQETALTRLLTPLGIAPDELGIRDLNYAHDPWRLRVVDHLLARPLDSVGVVRGMAAGLREARGNLAGLIRTAGSYLDLRVREASGPSHARRDLVDVLWALRGDSAGAVRTRADVEEQARRVPAAIRTVMADLLESMRAAAPLIREASATLSRADRTFLIHALSRVDPGPETLDETEPWRLLDLAARVDRGRLLAGATVVAAAVDRSRAALLRWRAEGRPGLDLCAGAAVRTDVADGDVCLALETVLGPVVVGGAGPTIYRGDAALIIDLGGRDRYENRAGGTVDPARPIAIVIDLDGDDEYVSTAPFSQGAAAFGVGILVDLDGHDTYVAGDFAQGAGLFGVGLLVDTVGGDRYEATAYSQGAGLFGLGVLVDDAGDDRYRATAFAQGFGAPGGLGALLDEAGDDGYVLAGGPADFREPDRAQSFGQGFAIGFRPLASGGIGLLADHAGDDRYVAEYFAQGASYWLAVGGLVDDAGNDRYEARRYAQGAGVHLSIGVLWEGAGDDEYRSWGVSQGCGHDLAVGILADAGGSDRYVATWLSQGVGNDDGMGLLLDLGGDDRFVASGADTQGRGNTGRRSQSLGFFVKLGGSSAYEGRGRPDSRWDGFEYGGGLDARNVPLGIDLTPRRDPLAAAGLTAFGPEAPVGYPRPADPRFRPRDETGRAVQALVLRLIVSLQTPEADRARAEAQAALRAMGTAAVPALLDLLGATQGGVALVVVETLVSLGEAAHPGLVERLSDASWLVRRRAALVLSQTATAAAARILATTAVGQSDPVIRRAAAAALGRAPSEDAAGFLVSFLGRDPDLEVRVAAAMALEAVPGVAGREALARAVRDPAFPVRLAARKSLATIGRQVDALGRWATATTSSPSPVARRIMLVAPTSPLRTRDATNRRYIRW